MYYKPAHKSFKKYLSLTRAARVTFAESVWSCPLVGCDINSWCRYASSGHFFRLGSGGSLIFATKTNKCMLNLILQKERHEKQGKVSCDTE